MIDGGVDRDDLSGALDAFAKAGVGRIGAAIAQRGTPEQRADALRDVLVAIEESPLPGYEWEPLTELLGEASLAELVGASVSSVARYRTAERRTPDHVAARLHTLALITADLAGSYNDFGIRRWFGRNRSALDGNSPSETLTGEWSPDECRVHEVRTLARALQGAPRRDRVPAQRQSLSVPVGRWTTTERTLAPFW